MLTFKNVSRCSRNHIKTIASVTFIVLPFLTFFSFVAHVTSVPALYKDLKATLQLVEDFTVINYVFSHFLMPLAMQSGHRVTNECGQPQPQQQLILRLCYTHSRLRVDTGDGITTYGIRTDCCSVKRGV